MRGESARPGKRPLRALSASEKMEAIQRVHEGESKASVARDIGVPESTLRGWCKSEHKIRGMARNSSTPDSEAHSPASSSGTNLAMTAGGANHSSEDEGPAAKRAKIDHQTVIPGSSFCANENSENEASRLGDASKIDYVGLMTSMAGMRPENSSLLLQQLGLHFGAASNTLAKSLLNLSTSVPHSSTVGLVENGLQYTRNNTKRHSLSAIAPTQMDSVAKSCTRKSLPPAAEAPLTPVPASPRKTNEMIRESKNKHKDPATHSRKVDEQLWMWLTQQQQILGQQSTPFTPSNHQDGSWFWRGYKHCSFPLMSPTPTPLVARKSPSKARALLDNVLCNNNNNENVRRSLNDVNETIVVDNQSDAPVISTEEAIEHGELFLKWLDKCSEPVVTRLQIMQFKYLLDNLKSCRKKSSSLKQSRK
ncbi:protein distal antenna-like [Chelonus insularis]|uniref:protein distal antenna-like n=1 Tax=Chelonus insularis TaxID=460826 RepID=UPI00158E5FB7|nr:protein distal antenna-like [Chelonus insularis]